MTDFVEKAKEAMERRRRSERRQKLFHLLELIMAGKIDSSKTPLARIFNTMKGPRQEYVSPENRGSYNYGYMETDEMR
jgi:hypothetical protein